MYALYSLPPLLLAVTLGSLAERGCKPYAISMGVLAGLAMSLAMTGVDIHDVLDVLDQRHSTAR